MDGSTSRSVTFFVCVSCFSGYPCLIAYLLCIDHVIGRSTEASEIGLSNCEMTVFSVYFVSIPIRLQSELAWYSNTFASWWTPSWRGNWPILEWIWKVTLTTGYLINHHYIYSQSVYLYAHLFEQPLCCERTHNAVFHFYPLQMRRPYRSSQNWSSQKTCSEEVPVCIQSWIDYKLNVDKPHWGVRL